MVRRALITGITGQDGSYLAEYLLDLGYEVHGIVRRVALEDQRHRLGRIHHLLDKIHLSPGSLDSYASIFSLLSRIPFDECYHLAAQSFVAESFIDGVSTMAANTVGTHYILAGLKELRPNCRFYFAGSSEMFGDADETPQTESTSLRPRSPYGISKVTGYHLVRNFREKYGLFCCSGILYNHESPRRGFEYVTRKVTSTAARIKLGLANEVRLGNLDAQRDWGHARDYIRAMHLMLQQPEPDDYVIATGETHSVRELCEVVFSELGMDYRSYVKIDKQLVRPPDPGLLIGDASKARRKLGWQPETTFAGLLQEMVQSDLQLARSEVRHNASR